MHFSHRAYLAAPLATGAPCRRIVDVACFISAYHRLHYNDDYAMFRAFATAVIAAHAEHGRA